MTLILSGKITLKFFMYVNIKFLSSVSLCVSLRNYKNYLMFEFAFFFFALKITDSIFLRQLSLIGDK